MNTQTDFVMAAIDLAIIRGRRVERELQAYTRRQRHLAKRVWDSHNKPYNPVWHDWYNAENRSLHKAQVKLLVSLGEWQTTLCVAGRACKRTGMTDTRHFDDLKGIGRDVSAVVSEYKSACAAYATICQAVTSADPLGFLAAHLADDQPLSSRPTPNNFNLLYGI